MGVIPVEEYPPMANLPTLYLPMFWLEEGISITGEVQFMIRLLHFGQGFNALMKWLFLLGSIAGGATCGYFLMNRAQSTEVLPVEPIESRVTSAGIVKTGATLGDLGSRTQVCFSVGQKPNSTKKFFFSFQLKAAGYNKNIQY